MTGKSHFFRKSSAGSFRWAAADSAAVWCRPSSLFFLPALSEFSLNTLGDHKFRLLHNLHPLKQEACPHFQGNWESLRTCHQETQASQAGDYRVTDTVFQTQNRLNQGLEVSTPHTRKTLKLFFKGQNTVRKTFTSTVRRTGQTEWLSLSSALHWDGTESQLRFFNFFSWYFVYF